MSLVSWFRTKIIGVSPRSGSAFDDIDRIQSAQQRKLNAELRQLQKQLEIQTLRQQVEELKAEYEGDEPEDDGDLDLDNELKHVFLNMAKQKFGVGGAMPTQPPQGMDFQKLQQTFMTWANENNIPMNKVIELKGAIEKDLNM